MKIISISAVVDVVGALATGSMENNYYLVDSNKAGGSTNEGTGALQTKVEKGDTLIWSIVPLEPEAYTTIADITVDSEYCEPQRKVYDGSDIVYWEGTIKEDLVSVPYTITFHLGTTPESLMTSEAPGLIG